VGVFGVGVVEGGSDGDRFGLAAGVGSAGWSVAGCAGGACGVVFFEPGFLEVEEGSDAVLDEFGEVASVGDVGHAPAASWPSSRCSSYASIAAASRSGVSPYSRRMVAWASVREDPPRARVRPRERAPTIRFAVE